MTQPAFGRRIRALENWIGEELIDRSVYPVKLTPAGETFLEVGRNLIRDMYRVRDDCRNQSGKDQYAFSISAFHTIALHILPKILVEMEGRLEDLVARVFETDFHGCIESLASARSDIAFCYSHVFGPPIPGNGKLISKTITIGKFCLACAPERYDELTTAKSWNGSPRLPLISYSPETFLAKIQRNS